ncbi:MAG: GtrA family protein [Rhodanobacteraceae bacterium]
MELPDRLAARAAAFSLAGVANTAVGVLAILIAGALGTSAVLANVIGYGLGLIASFTLNARITFRHRTLEWMTVLRFLVAFAIAFTVNIGVVVGAEHIRHIPKSIASLAGTPLYVVVFFLLCEYWVFRHPPTLGTPASKTVGDTER